MTSSVYFGSDVIKEAFCTASIETRRNVEDLHRGGRLSGGTGSFIFFGDPILFVWKAKKPAIIDIAPFNLSERLRRNGLIE